MNFALLFLIFSSSIHSFLIKNSKYQLDFVLKSDDQKSSLESKKQIYSWSHPYHSAEKLNKYWKDRDSLLTVGSKGVTDAHINSLRELLLHHQYVRGKVSSDKINTIEIANFFNNNENISSFAELLEVRGQGFMFGRKSNKI
jgi:RNA-binding protein YhbY